MFAFLKYLSKLAGFRLAAGSVLRRQSLVSNGRQSKQTGSLVLIKDILLPSALELFTNVQL